MRKFTAIEYNDQTFIFDPAAVVGFRVSEAYECDDDGCSVVVEVLMEHGHVLEVTGVQDPQEVVALFTRD